MKKFLTGIVLLLVITTYAKVPPATVTSAFTKMFPGTKVTKWGKEDSNYEADFMKDNKKMSATFDAKGAWKETETDIPLTDLPATANSYIKANYKGAAIKAAAILSRPGSAAKMYEANVKGKDLLFDEHGKFLKAEQD